MARGAQVVVGGVRAAEFRNDGVNIRLGGEFGREGAEVEEEGRGRGGLLAEEVVREEGRRRGSSGLVVGGDT